MIAPWMLYTVVVGALLAGAGALAERGLRLLGRPVRGIWAAAVVLAILLPMLTALRPGGGATAAATGAEALTLTAPAASAGVPTLPSLPSLDAPLLAAWALLSLTLFGALLHGVGVLHGRRREWRRAEVEGRAVLVATDTGPAVIGWRRMQVVLPAWVLELNSDTRQLILAHEEEHIRRGDPALLLGGLVAALLVPWNAPLWYLYRRLRLAIELDCDARVVAGGADVARYGEVLLVAGARTRGGRLPALATFAERATQLETRLTALTPDPVRRRWPRVAGAGAIAALVLVAACTIQNPLEVDLTRGGAGGEREFSPVVAVRGIPPAVRRLVTMMVEQRYPGALAAGAVPEEAVVVMLMTPERQVLEATVTATRDAGDSPNALSMVGADQIESVEVLRGRAIGIENLGVMMVELRPGATLPRRRMPGPGAEVPAGETRLRQPLLERGATGTAAGPPAGAGRQSGETRLRTPYRENGGPGEVRVRQPRR